MADTTKIGKATVVGLDRVKSERQRREEEAEARRAHEAQEEAKDKDKLNWFTGTHLLHDFYDKEFDCALEVRFAGDEPHWTLRIESAGISSEEVRHVLDVAEERGLPVKFGLFGALVIG